MGYYLVYVRHIRALLMWHDPHLTAWLAILCAALVVVLPLLPWAALLRVLGIVLFGPHNYPIWREWRAKQEDYELSLTLVRRSARARSHPRAPSRAHHAVSRSVGGASLP